MLSPAKLLCAQTAVYLKNEIFAIFPPSAAPGVALLPISLFLIVATVNVIGLAPYVFTATSHLSFTLALSAPLWAGHIAFALAKTPIRVIAHLVPLGTPPLLMPFIVIIELTRRAIRPLTLAVRLAANIIAGHLLLALVSGPAPNATVASIGLILVAALSLSVLESAVALIQAYVFTILSTLYINEVNSPALRY